MTWSPRWISLARSLFACVLTRSRWSCRSRDLLSLALQGVKVPRRQRLIDEPVVRRRSSTLFILFIIIILAFVLRSKCEKYSRGETSVEFLHDRLEWWAIIILSCEQRCLHAEGVEIGRNSGPYSSTAPESLQYCVHPNRRVGTLRIKLCCRSDRYTSSVDRAIYAGGDYKIHSPEICCMVMQWYTCPSVWMGVVQLVPCCCGTVPCLFIMYAIYPLKKTIFIASVTYAISHADILQRPFWSFPSFNVIFTLLN